jgi:hypothetical protein
VAHLRFTPSLAASGPIGQAEEIPRGMYGNTARIEISSELYSGTLFVVRDETARVATPSRASTIATATTPTERARRA